MRILIIQNYGGLGGGSRSCFDIAKILSKQGHEVYVSISHPDISLQKIAKENSFSIVSDAPDLVTYNFHSASGLSIKTILKHLAERKNLREWNSYLKCADYLDLVILNSSVLSPLANAVKSSGKKCFVFIRETYRKNFLMNLYIKSRLRLADKLFYLTNFDLKQWQISPSKSYVVPDIVDETMFFKSKEKVESNNAFTLLFMGGFNYYKGAIDVLKAIELLTTSGEQSNIRFIILGGLCEEYDSLHFINKVLKLKHILYRNKCVKLANKLNKLNNVSVDLIGLTENVSKYYLECDAVIFPVKKVHQPRPAYEAGFFGKPIIVPDYPNFRENIENMENGFVYKRNNCHDLSRLLRNLISDRRLIVSVGANNKIRTEKNHSFKNANNAIKEALHS